MSLGIPWERSKGLCMEMELQREGSCLVEQMELAAAFEASKHMSMMLCQRMPSEGH